MRRSKESVNDRIASAVRESWKRDADPEYAALQDENERLRREAQQRQMRDDLAPERARLAAENEALRGAVK